MVVARNIRDQVHGLGIPHMGSATAAYVTVSVGVATSHCLPGMAPDLWIKAADHQLYLAKSAGRNNVIGTIFGTGREANQNQIELARLIPTPIDQNRWAQYRNPMDIMVQGWSTSRFHASQQWSRMFS
jgi:hypothetical protein